MHTTFIDHLVPNGLEVLEVEPGCATVLTVPRRPDDPTLSSPLWLVGEVDLVTAPALAEHVRNALPRNVAGLIVLDVSRVTFMDLTGLRMLLRLQADLSGDGMTLVLRAPSSPVRLMLKVARPWARLAVLAPPATERTAGPGTRGAHDQHHPRRPATLPPAG